MIPYYGGKARIASRIVEEINKISHTVYCEPFCGGASVFWQKKHTIPSDWNDYREVLNDSSEDLINLYRVLQTDFKMFQHKIKYTLYSESEHRLSKLILKNKANYSELDQAWAYYVNICQGFANGLNKGWGRSVKSQNKAATWNNRKTELDLICDRLSTVHISCTDALKCIKDWDSQHTLFYLDPPYPDSDQGHYSGYPQSDFEDLLELLKTINGSFILSCYPNPAVPKEWKKVEIKAIMSASAKGKVRRDRALQVTDEELGDRERIECLWICDRSSQILSTLPLFKIS
jgi:DNA adenine methylase